MSKSKQDELARLAKQILALTEPVDAANDDEEQIDEAAIRERARRAADRMRRARKR